MSAARHPTALKTSTFSNKDCEKHFQYVCYLSNSTTKLKRISETNNTPRDIARKKSVSPKANAIQCYLDNPIQLYACG